MPPTEPQPPVPHPQPAARPEPRPVGGRILVVEDSPLNQMLVSAILVQAGHRPDIANNGLEAVMAAQAGGYDLILMDLSMPEMDGLTATRLVRGLPGAAGRVPVVAMTADTDEADRTRCQGAGMNDHVAKPVDRAQLLATVGKWLQASLPAGFGPGNAVPAAREGEVLDHDVLAQLAQDLDADLLEDVLRQFVAETRERVERMAAAADTAILMREAHTLKSTAGTFGARALCAAARTLEAACREAEAGGPADEADRLRGEIPRLAGEAIAAYRAAGYPV
ncbi:response regulator [Azospirillum picis]|uniref:CheY-like chemotaxis protein/HPt (Histidine-containing phosphotransfer) domain-containing protein n=1 Tax=Azospirillum picis TaxID=488438 RepID=A0ABU0MLA4_9PROT|nr:response regulator [Azospirillum picis]MBP2300442.1 CheY-like chemotaxis protein/HPt (histidine-containing phosphotransfer) domain-containing protein [Azospirillum picis]MDQ0534238.1 CheY-like chemotaxis protein/HPt (histidine-containing phosphotransfer) domain-containing protein [Azospirillum picis]